MGTGTGIEKAFPTFGNGNEKLIPKLWERESEARIPKNGRKREFLLTPEPDSPVYKLPRQNGRLMTDSLKGFHSDAGIPSWHSYKPEYDSWGHPANTWTENPEEGCRIDYVWFALTGRSRPTGSLSLTVPSYINRNPRMDSADSQSLSDHSAIDVTFRVTEV